MEVREATVEDAGAMGVVHVNAWQAAYRGLMPDDHLDGLVPADRAAMWRRTITEDDSTRLVLVGVDDDGVVRAFSAAGPALDGSDWGRVYVINVDPVAWGTGLASALFERAVRHLRTRRHPAAELWVADGNARARRFYEKHGWRPDGRTVTEDVFGATVTEARYVRNPL